MAEIRREVSRAIDETRYPRISGSRTVEANGGYLSCEVTFDARKPRFSNNAGRIANPDDPDGPGEIRRTEEIHAIRIVPVKMTNRYEP